MQTLLTRVPDGTRSALTRKNTKYQTPHKGGRVGAVAASGLLLPPRPAAAYSGSWHGACRPLTPWAAPPVRPSAHGPLLRSISHGVGGSAWRWAALLSTGRRDPLFFPLQREIFKREASEARQARRAAPCGQVGWALWVCGQLCCPQIHGNPLLVHRADQACR